MFESALLKFLNADSELCAYVSKFNAVPSIFSDMAPENVPFPYLVFKINQMSGEDAAIRKFNIFVDIYDVGVSRVQNRKIAKLIENKLDYIVLQHENYGSIRFFYFAGSTVDEQDPKQIHYNLQFSARAGRKTWPSQF